MAMKKCPNCGKRIAPKAQYCIYCAVRFDEDKSTKYEVEETAEEAVLSDNLDITDVDLSDFNETADDTIVVEDDDFAKESISDMQTEGFEDETKVLEVLPTEIEKNTVSLDLPAEESSKAKRSVRSNFWLVVSIVGFVLIACGAVLLIVQTVFRSDNVIRDTDETVATTTTCPTRDSQRDAWMQTFVGEWFDEYSVGKKDIETQGGYKLTITKVDKDWIFFDLHSYSGGELSKMASVTGFQEKMVDDTLHFEFSNDGLGNAGEGHLQFAENAVNMEVVIFDTTEPPAHSLAVNAVFMRQQLPLSTGVDIHSLTDETALTTALGEPISVSEYNENNIKMYEYNSLKAQVHKDGRVLTISVNLTNAENKEMYCFDCVDGSDTYDIVKAYYGEAEQDYQESPTDIHVLRYSLSETSSIKFIFSCDEHLLIKMYYIL